MPALKKTFKIFGLFLLLLLMIYALYYYINFSFKGDEKVKIIEKYESIHSVSELLKNPNFKNKVIYIDMWGVYCGACINEFRYMPELKLKFKDKAVVFIYLAAPYNNFNDVERWKAGLKKYRLEGYNMLMSRQFYNQIWKEIPQMKDPFMIPHYLIIDKNGKIIDPNAPWPRYHKEVVDKITALL